jgi:type IV pilus assembly protein PilQ
MYDNYKSTRGFLTWALRLLPVAILLACTTAVGAQGNAAALGSDVPMGNMVVDPNQAQVEGDLIKFIAFQKESTIRDGLRLLAALCKKNIVPSAGVEGPLTVSRLYNVSFEEALKAVLGYGFRCDLDGDFVRVYTTAEYKTIKEDPERMVHKVITLYYITAAEAVKLIQPVLSSAAQVQTSTPAESNISSGGGSGSGSASLSGGGGGDKMAHNDMIVVFDYPERIQEAVNIIAQIDRRPQQVLIEATILSARLREDMEFGIDWNLLSGLPVTSGIITSGSGYGTPIETYGFAKIPGSTGLTAGFIAGNIRAVITALEEVTDTTVLANPKILAVNKQEGQLLIGRKFGYEDTSTTTLTGGTTASTAFLETGTRLVFRPYIGNDGYIRMDIYPKDSDGSLQSNGKPLEDTTELRTNVIVKDGETVVIGGLFRDGITTSRSQVPVLGSLPFVGVAFRGTKDIATREEVVVMLTPHIIDEPSEVRGDDRAEDVRIKMEGARQAMQPLDRAKLAEDAYAKAAKFYLEGDVDSAVFHVKVALMMRPTYLEARRLHERIMAETDPEELKRIDSIVNQAIDQQEAAKWRR